MAVPPPGELSRLYRHILRAAGSFTDYNFRCYFQRRAREDFRGFADRCRRGEMDAAGTETFLQGSQEHLEMLKRMGVVSQLYAAPPRSPR
mmetsp:Transcript_97134/g.296814  ORF Transcript_97134/g.296814 Transcript_97134/m.296814 type:complete len:90 (-) Transcript_97134:16-285(-)